MNWFFACWCKFRKAKSFFNDLRVGAVKNGLGHSVNETLKSVVSLEWVYELNWFFACWLWWSNFWLDRYRILYILLLTTAVVLVGPPAVVGMVLWNRVCPSYCRPVCLGVILQLSHLVSLNFGMFGMVLETLIMLCMAEPGFLKNFCRKNWGNRSKIRFFEFRGKFGQWFSLNLFYNENLYYLLCSWINPIFGENLVPEI